MNKIIVLLLSKRQSARYELDCETLRKRYSLLIKIF